MAVKPAAPSPASQLIVALSTAIVISTGPMGISIGAPSPGLKVTHPVIMPACGVGSGANCGADSVEVEAGVDAIDGVIY